MFKEKPTWRDYIKGVKKIWVLDSFNDDYINRIKKWVLDSSISWSSLYLKV
jgi:hypothetical protein